MKHNPKNYVVEVHFNTDVFSRDYGPEQGCAMRALERMRIELRSRQAQFRELRLWHSGKCIMSMAAHDIQHCSEELC